MNFDNYQDEAQITDQHPGKDEVSLVVPLLGLAGETGSLLTEYKKLLRDGSAYKVFSERIQEELGDILWYLANIATKAGLRLEDVARSNLRKIGNRWTPAPEVPLLPGSKFLDAEYPENERLPRTFAVTIREEAGPTPRVRISMNGEQIGSHLTDNAYKDDGYRFHDVFHLAFAAVLGWSPVARAIMKKKRKSNPRTDEVEDGGRAAVIDEAIAALAFDYAKKHAFLKGVTMLDYSILNTIKSLTEHLEVNVQSLHTWERAILQAFDVWRLVVANRGGIVIGNLYEGTVTFQKAVE
ncbi:MAG TPA: nucleoside triphosphate pyrophosphohydrolase family protein [Candidatus Angelobacter sp.]|nr:nucleoside triphosphate pyrophosphohydrolase family protein [Candidatus Angelobacter sp.]